MSRRSSVLLFDTCILIPWLAGEALPETFVAQVRREGAFVSPISIWEIWTKIGIGKLAMQTDSLVREVEEAGLSWLPLLPRHAEAIRDLPMLHKDPFDRLLIAQALYENLIPATRDRMFRNYLPNTLLI